MNGITENEFYSRQLILENFGPENQELLRKSCVLVVGAGGLGCPALQYLTGAGVGTITVVDGDKVQVNNLHRQILFNTNDIGLFKAETAAKSLTRLNPLIHINYINDFISIENIDIILSGCDVVVDATDNYNTRFLLGDYTANHNIPLVYAAIYEFEGQLTVFNYKNGPSLRDLFPAMPNSKAIPNCATNGVIGFVPGIMGVLQATEAIKIVTDLPTVYSGKLQQINLLNLNVKEISYQKHKIKTLIEPKFTTNQIKTMKIQEITSKELHNRLTDNPESLYLLDVREPHEWNQFNIGGTRIPMLEISSRLNEISPDKDIVVICHSGYRSHKVAEMLVNNQEYKNVFNLKGGLVAWVNEFGS